MKKMYNIVVEKFLFLIPSLMFLLYTNVHYLFLLKSNSRFITKIINGFNALHMKSAYIYFIISLILGIYILINGNHKHKLITLITVIGCFFTYNYLLFTETTISEFLTSLLFVSSYLMGIFYTLALLIYLKNKNIEDIKKQIIIGAKVSVIYVAIIFALAILSNTSQYSYATVEQGLTAWFRSTNGLGHALVFLLPLFILFYVEDKTHKYLFYIIVISILDLLIGTKACYYGLLSTLIITIIYLLFALIKKTISLF